MEKNDAAAMALGGLAVGGAIALVPIMAVIYAYTLSCLWAWFQFGELTGITPGLAQWYGVSIVVSLLTPTPKNERSTGETIALGFTKPALALLVGYIASGFVA